MNNRGVQKDVGRIVLKGRACLSFVFGVIGVYEPGVSKHLTECREFSERSCVHILFIMFILHLLVVGATWVLDAHLFSWNILGNGPPAVLCW